MTMYPRSVPTLNTRNAFPEGPCMSSFNIGNMYMGYSGLCARDFSRFLNSFVQSFILLFISEFQNPN